MKKSGILHGELSKLIAEAGHGETVVVSDYGLPIPEGVKWIDLAVTEGVPSFLTVLEAILEELTIEKVTLTNELANVNPTLLGQVQSLTQKEASLIDHESFKKQCKNAKVIVRTGEWTPYANVLLHSGVVF